MSEEELLLLKTADAIAAQILAVIAVTFTAFCVWLGVRIVNRRERWAKRTAVVFAVLAAYSLGVWPALWISSRIAAPRTRILTAYRPLAWAFWKTPEAVRSFLNRRFLFPAIRESGRNVTFNGDGIYFVN
jgi:hypothetical protein